MIKLFKNYLFVYRFIAMRLMQSYVFFRNQTTFATILPQISLCLGGASHRLHRSAQNFLQSGASHRLHRFTQDCLLGMFSHRLHGSTQMVRLRKIVAEVSLPPQQQNASHRLHRFTQKLLTSGGALVSARLCRLPEQEVHQHSKRWSSHRFHRFTQMVRLLKRETAQQLLLNSCWAAHIEVSVMRGDAASA